MARQEAELGLFFDTIGRALSDDEIVFQGGYIAGVYGIGWTG